MPIPLDLYGNPIGYLTGQALLVDIGEKATRPKAKQDDATDKKIEEQYHDHAATAELFTTPTKNGPDTTTCGECEAATPVDSAIHQAGAYLCPGCAGETVCEEN